MYARLAWRNDRQSRLVGVAKEDAPRAAAAFQVGTRYRRGARHACEQLLRHQRRLIDGIAGAPNPAFLRRNSRRSQRITVASGCSAPPWRSESPKICNRCVHYA
jgi:hypothetical protein